MGIEVWRAEAPSNIALIKYMGKAESRSNQPANASLSYTIDHLVTAVEIRPNETPFDQWEPLVEDGFSALQLSESGRVRFLDHFQFLKSEFQIHGGYTIRSANNFPADCGLASSASSFAALTRAAYELGLDRGQPREVVEAFTLEELSILSRRGSGSSCRSFFRPWALWRGEGAEPVQLPYEKLHHQVVIIETGKKEVSSSEAHKRVVTSELFNGRATRAEHRLQQILAALNERDWKRSCDLAWAEFWDMHALFETSVPAFGYMSPKSLQVLNFVREVWRELGDGPMATMDAGANVHLLYRTDQGRIAERISTALSETAQVIRSREIRGGRE